MATAIQQISAVNSSLAASLTRYYPLTSNTEAEANSNEAAKTMIYRSAGVISNLYINILTNDRAASTLKVRKGTADANGAVTITGSTTGKFEDTSNTDTVAAGDNFHYQIITGAGGTVFTFTNIQTLFSATTNTVQRMAGQTFSWSASGQTTWGGFFNSGARVGEENDVELITRTPATLTNFFLYIESNDRTTTTTFRSRVNGANGNLVISLLAGVTGSVEDTSNSDTLASGDTFNWQIVTGASTESGSTARSIAIDFTTTNSKFMFACGESSGSTLTASATVYSQIAGYMALNATEANVNVEANLAFTASNLQTWIVSNSITANSTLRFRIGGANGNQVVTITASTSGLFQDASNTDTVLATDIINYSLVGGATGSSLSVYSIQMLGTVAGGVPTAPYIGNQFYQLLGVGT